MNQFKLKNGAIVSKKKILHKDGYMIIEPHKEKIIFKMTDKQIKNRINVPFDNDINGFVVPEFILSKYELPGSEYEWTSDNTFVVKAVCQGKLPKGAPDNGNEIEDNQNQIEARIQKLEMFCDSLTQAFSSVSK